MKAHLPKGTRDFLPIEVRRRNFIFDTVKNIFEIYGYVPIETPAMEDLRTLQGKYGDEGDQLLFKVLNNGDFLRKADKEALKNMDSDKLVPSISKRGLKYDLTVPFSRYVAMNQNELQFPFKRYQIQPVWRADRPQKGRYQEFYQCDVDVIGSDSLLYEAELLSIYQRIFRELNLSVVIRVSNRKILAGIAEVAKVQDKFIKMTTIIDKLDKIGMERVLEELANASFPAESIETIQAILEVEKLKDLKAFLSDSSEGLQGIKELETVFDFVNLSGGLENIKFDVTLARGLSYYTGFICEVISTETKMGSIGGGGRYADLTSIFGLKNMSGVGVSLGAERIYDIMLELDKFPDSIADSIQAFFVSFDEESLKYNYKMVQELRSEGIAVDIYPEPKNVGKQLKYANQCNYNKVVITGSEERTAGKYQLKDMNTGEEKLLSGEELRRELRNSSVH